MKKINAFILLIAGALLSTTAGPVWAADITLSAPEVVGVGQEIAVDVIVQAGDIQVNAFSGEVRVEGAEVTGINEAISGIGIWIEVPKLVDDKITWSGITTGARTGDIRMFRLYLRAIETEATVSFSNIEVYEHDGKATPVPIAPTVYTIDARVQAESPSPASLEKWDDVWPPEPFNIEVSYDQNLFEQVPVALFNTTDKQTGIARYEVALDEGEYHEATSPFLLPQGTRSARVKAIDRAGNEQISRIYFEKQTSSMSVLLFIGVIAGAVLCLIAIYAAFPRR